MKRVQGIVVGLLMVGGVFGYRLYEKKSSRDEVRGQLASLCESDAACVAAVGEHFETCFESSFDLGNRRRGASLDREGLVGCINESSGEEYFRVSRE